MGDVVTKGAGNWLRGHQTEFGITARLETKGGSTRAMELQRSRPLPRSSLFHLFAAPVSPNDSWVSQWASVPIVVLGQPRVAVRQTKDGFRIWPTVRTAPPGKGPVSG